MKSTPSAAALLSVNLPKGFPYRCPAPWCQKSYEKATWYRRHILDRHPSYRSPQAPTDTLAAEAGELLLDDVQPSPNSVGSLSDGAEIPNTNVDNDFEDYDDAEDDQDAVVTLSELFKKFGLGNPAEFWHNPEIVPPPSPNKALPTQSTMLAESADTSREVTFNEAGRGTPADEKVVLEALQQPWAPFKDEEDYRLAEWFVESNTPATHVDAFFRTPTGRRAAENGSFTSNYMLRKLIDKMTDGLSWASWKAGEIHLPAVPGLTPARTGTGVEKLQFYHRDPLDVVKWLIGQPANAENLVYAPVKQYEEDRRIYSEMHTADWWWKTQAQLPEGGTVVPVILMSDSTHLTGFSGDKKAWPIYMTIGNLTRSVRAQTSSYSTVLLALLPVPPKFKKKMKSADRTAQQLRNREVLEKALTRLLEPLMNPDGIEMDCADLQRRNCFPRLAAWIADYPEYCELHGIKLGSCMWCECPRTELGELKMHQERDHQVYSRWWRGHRDDLLAVAGVKNVENPAWWLPGVNVARCAKPDILHTIYIGLMAHLMTWLQGFLAAHKRLGLFEEVWKSIPAYDSMARQTKSYSEISQLTGKEYRRFLHYLPAVLQATLCPKTPSPVGRPTPAVADQFEHAMLCVKGFVSFALYSQYDCHDGHTLNLMDGALELFHKHKDVFLEWRKSKTVQGEVEELLKELRAQRDDELDVLREDGISGGALQRKKDEWKAFIESERQEYLSSNSNFNFPKLHLMSHFTETVREFGALQQWSTEVQESSHMRLLKDGYRTSNRNKEYILQVLNYDCRREAFAVRRLNMNALWRRLDLATTQFDSLPAVSEPKLALAGPVLRKDIKCFGDLGNGCSASIDELAAAAIQLPGLKSTFGSVERLRKAPCVAYRTIMCPVRNFATNELECQRARCTGTLKWHLGPPRNDWVWISHNDNLVHHRGERRPRLTTRRGRAAASEKPAMEYLRVVELVRLFTIASDKGLWNCAIVRPTTPTDSGYTQHPMDLCHVTRRTADVLKVIPITRIIGPAHVLPESGTGPPNAWWVNSYIDATSWNTVTNEEGGDAGGPQDSVRKRRRPNGE